MLSTDNFNLVHPMGLKVCPHTLKQIYIVYFSPDATANYTNGVIYYPFDYPKRVIGVKLNYLNVPQQSGEGKLTTTIQCLGSQHLGAYFKKNRFCLATDGFDPNVTVGRTASNIISNCIGYATPLSTNVSSNCSTYDVNRINWFAQPADIQYFDWYVFDALTNSQIQWGIPFELSWEIEFFFACECKK